MDGTSALIGAQGQQINLQNLVSAIQNAVQAQNLIASNLKTLNAAFALAFPAPLTGSATYDPPNIASGASASTTISVAGAVLGNYVSTSFSLDLQGLTLSAYVSAANVVTAVLSNLTGSPVNLGSGILRARVTTS